MRLWSIHPKYLDAKGLVALWRETLLARKVLLGKTKGYVKHPQLIRFRGKYKQRYIELYLAAVFQEAEKRYYHFDGRKLNHDFKNASKITVSSGQMAYEFEHLQSKLKKRSPEVYKINLEVKKIIPNPIFRIVKGKIEKWEKAKYE